MSLVYRVTRLQAADACVMPVRPGSEGACDPRTPDDRTELCATEAWWLLGDLGLCDQHLRQALAAAGDSYQAMLARYRRRFPELVAGVPFESERLPWSQRPRRLDRVRATAPRRSAGRRWRQSPAGELAARSLRQRCGR